IDGGTVFAVGHAGRMVAVSYKTGERLWSLTVPSIQAPYVAGDSVFVVDTSGQLMAITRREGKIQWTAKLPGSTTWSGPVLAGARRWGCSPPGPRLCGSAPDRVGSGRADAGAAGLLWLGFLRGPWCVRPVLACVG